PKDARELGDPRVRFDQMLDHLAAEHEVERLVLERDLLQLRADELRCERRRRLARGLEDAVRDVDGRGATRPERRPRERAEIAPVAAPGVEERVARKSLLHERPDARELPVMRVGPPRRRVLLERTALVRLAP